MWIRVRGATLVGVEGLPVWVEVDAGRGLPSFQIVGQPDRVVNESRDRIRAAFRQSALEFPPGRVTVNLAPSDLPKAGPALDLPIAVAVAAARLSLEPEALERALLLGELGLDGRLHGVRGALPLTAVARQGGTEAVVPVDNLGEASICPGVRVYGAPDLRSVLAWLRGDEPLDCDTSRPPEPERRSLDLGDVRAQESAKRALEIAAAGGHNALLIGPPGSGKTLLARRLPGLLPRLELDAALEATRIHSVAGTLGGQVLVERPPFRAPHHTISDAGLIGGGRPLRPGEVTLAHRGVLFLDELPEFRRPVLEALRQPLEEGVVRVARAHGALELPAGFQLIAAMNPCPCGYRGDPQRECECDDPSRSRYRAKLSGPLLDRIDLHVPVPAVPWRRILPRPGSTEAGETSATVGARVVEARDRQARRQQEAGFGTNAELPHRLLARFCPLDEAARALLERSLASLGLSMRAATRVLRIARTIADLDGAEHLQRRHVAEATGFRQLDRRTQGVGPP